MMALRARGIKPWPLPNMEGSSHGRFQEHRAREQPVCAVDGKRRRPRNGHAATMLVIARDGHCVDLAEPCRTRMHLVGRRSGELLRLRVVTGVLKRIRRRRPCAAARNLLAISLRSPRDLGSVGRAGSCEGRIIWGGGVAACCFVFAS